MVQPDTECVFFLIGAPEARLHNIMSSVSHKFDITFGAPCLTRTQLKLH